MTTRIPSDDDQSDSAVEVFNGSGAAPFLIVCEHASNFIPDDYAGLGLDGAGSNAHVAWDPGALGTARRVAEALGAPLVASRMSRLLHDCNRPAASPEAMPARSEAWIIPGNAGLTEAERQARARRIYVPFHEAVTKQLDRLCGQDDAPALITIHTFTPVYFGQVREVEIGILHDADSRLADAMLAIAGGARSSHDVRRNEPYAAVDGVTHTLKVHALPRGLANVMIEVRNDLVSTEGEQASMGDWLAHWIAEAAATIRAGMSGSIEMRGGAA